MKLFADANVLRAYRATKATLNRFERAGAAGTVIDELQARVEFLERVFDV